MFAETTSVPCADSFHARAAGLQVMVRRLCRMELSWDWDHGSTLRNGDPVKDYEILVTSRCFWTTLWPANWNWEYFSNVWDVQLLSWNSIAWTDLISTSITSYLCTPLFLVSLARFWTPFTSLDSYCLRRLAFERPVFRGWLACSEGTQFQAMPVQPLDSKREEPSTALTYYAKFKYHTARRKMKLSKPPTYLVFAWSSSCFCSMINGLASCQWHENVG